MWFTKKKENPYKFKSLKTYAWDKTINNTRKYRKVFDRKEINYLSVALELYNKFFDEKDWKATITFTAYSLENGKKTVQHCTNTTEQTISKEENIAICDYGWGNDSHGSYWKKGDYIWEVFIDDKFVESAKFYIEDVGLVTPNENPYFTVISVKTFETNGSDEDNNKIYLKQFLYKHTHYIMTEFNFINHVPEEWLCEVFFNYYDDTGLLIGVTEDIGYITPNIGEGEDYSIIRGWGSKDPTIWLKDNYRIEVVFMDTVVAIIPFIVGDEIKARTNSNDTLINSRLKNHFNPPTTIVDKNLKEEDKISDDETPIEESNTINEEIEPTEPLDKIVEKLDNLIGLKDIKTKIREYIDYVVYLQLREEKGINEDETINLHSVFTGNPGTGKTTVVKLLGKIYKSLGLLSKGHVISVESNDLVSGYVRQTGENTKEFIEKARGGILFIDEAYMLFKEGVSNDFGPEATAVLLTEMSDGPGDIAIMVAGYPAEMESFINSNPGLKSRFRNYYHFNDYTPSELVQIANYAAKLKNLTISEKATKKIEKILTNAFRSRDKSFGNARLAHSIIEEAKINLGIRVVRNYEPSYVDKHILSVIKEEDVEDITQGNKVADIEMKVDTNLLEETLKELNKLTGISAIKKEVEELVRLSKYYREMNRDLLKAFSMHSVFLGNPGTGKTTVARILGKIYKALGLLERGHLIEADGSNLIAGFVGQSALKTKELIKSAFGGILFIDEAYAISENVGIGNNNDFGKKAIAALLKEMEDHRGEFGVIVAGYTENMQHFLETNPGMKSRFDRTFHFEDFTKDDLWKILLNMFADKEVKPDDESEVHLKKYISHLNATKNKFFGNARSIRKIVEKAFRNHELRMADLPKNKRTSKVMSTITLSDVQEFDIHKIKIANRTKIGYK
jgi:SpoVK/Ycf46/Vps4 family AAA+-type ATPase